MATPPALPRINEDPAIVAAMNIREELPGQLAAIRGRFGVSDLDKAMAVVKAYNTARREIAGHYENLVGRMTRRHEWLGQQIPFGPGIPADTSAADKAVLQTAFTNSLARARGTSLVSDQYGIPSERQQLLAEAMRFGDDVLVRAVLTVAQDEGQAGLVDQWVAGQAPEVAGHVEEWRDLSRTLAGGATTEGMWIHRALLMQLPVPAERAQLPTLVMHHNNRLQAAIRDHRARGGLAFQDMPEPITLGNLDAL